MKRFILGFFNSDKIDLYTTRNVFMSMYRGAKFYLLKDAKNVKFDEKDIEKWKKWQGRYENDYTEYEFYVDNDGPGVISKKQKNKLIYMGDDKFFRNNMSSIRFEGMNLIVEYITGEVFTLKNTEIKK